MWKRLLRATHPDSAGGSDDLFIWVENLRSYVLSDEPEEPPRRYRRDPPRHHSTTSAGDRIPFDDAAPFADLTHEALRLAEDVPDPFSGLLRLLRDCVEAGPSDPTLWRMQGQGATYRSLAAAAYRANMSKQERVRWYRIAEWLNLSQRHVGHILSRLSN
jgi:hypothetical protein